MRLLPEHLIPTAPPADVPCPQLLKLARALLALEKTLRTLPEPAAREQHLQGEQATLTELAQATMYDPAGEPRWEAAETLQRFDLHLSFRQASARWGVYLDDTHVWL